MVTLFRTEQQYRSLAQGLVEVACATHAGVPRRASDPTFQAIVHAGADTDFGAELLGGWLLRSLGVCSAFVDWNKGVAHSHGGMAWFEEAPCVRAARTDDVYRPGDILRVGYYPADSVVVVVEHTGDLLHYADYTPRGAQFSACIRKARYQLAGRSGAPYLDGRALIAWLPLMAVLEHANARGELVEPDAALFDSFEDTLPAVPGRVRFG